MLIARHAAAQTNLIAQFKAHSIHKSYYALAKGKLEPERGIIEAPIGRDPAHRKRMAVVSSGKEAATSYRVKEYLDGYTLLDISIETGRTHQIRVHLTAIGYPVAGDSVYGIKVKFLNRQFLHAWRLGFHLPSSGTYANLPASCLCLNQPLIIYAECGLSFTVLQVRYSAKTRNT